MLKGASKCGSYINTNQTLCKYDNHICSLHHQVLLAHIYRSLLYSIEIVEDLPNVDVVMVPCGGGGLIGGIALYLKHFKPSIQVCL